MAVLRQAVLLGALAELAAGLLLGAAHVGHAALLGGEQVADLALDVEDDADAEHNK